MQPLVVDYLSIASANWPIAERRVFQLIHGEGLPLSYADAVIIRVYDSTIYRRIGGESKQAPGNAQLSDDSIVSGRGQEIYEYEAHVHGATRY